MIDLGRRRISRILALLAMITFACAANVAPAAAQGLFNQIRYAAIVVDASSGEVLYSKRADDLRYPASITKIMTLYLTFEALSTGRLKPDDRVVVSQYASTMAPSKSSLRPGDSLTVDEAIRIVAVHSANDIAMALAEKVGGSEQRFAALMTLRAQELGMANTRYVNPHGLPDSRQVTTARDFAILARAVMRDYPQYYGYFGLEQTELRGKLYSNHNHLLKEPGYDGFKTGFTNAAGYNLVASAVRDGRRLITVVLGGSSAASRDENVQTLMTAGFDVLRKRALGERTTIAQNIAEPDDGGPIQQSVEQGDGGRPGLSAVVVDSLHGARDQLAEEEHESTTSAPPPGLRGRVTAPRATASVEEPCVAVSHKHGRTIRRAVACKGSHVQLAAVDCGKKRGRAKTACAREETNLAKATPSKGRHGRKETVAIAKASTSKAKAHHGRHHPDNA